MNRAHDLHHRNPNVNFGQYLTLWDRVFGSYMSYDAPIANKFS